MTMSMVAAAGSSPRFERLYGNTPAATGRAEQVERAPRRDDDDEARTVRRDDSGPGQRNPLVRALMQALQGLMPAQGASASPAATTAVATPADAGETATTAPAASRDGDTLKDAAVAFAHELFSALRSARDDDRGERGHRHHHHGHHGHHHGHGRDYGDLAQGLRKLAQSIESPAAPTPSPAPASPPASPPVATLPTPTPVVPADTAPPPADLPVTAVPPELAPIGLPTAAPAGGMSIEINIQVKIQWPGAATQATAPTPAPAEESPLLAAFKRLMDKLAPEAATGAAATDGPSAADKLKAFLNGIADALSGQGGASPAERPAPGSLISVAA
jgi:hypothetical protein